MRPLRALAGALTGLAGLAMFTTSTAAHADESIIKRPGDHPDYRFEAEPHGLFGFGGPFGSVADAGLGFRGTIIIVDNGFVKKINNSVGIGFGGDVFFRKGTVFLPVVMQWNFFLSNHWSVFAEPGFGITANANVNKFFPLHPTGYLGGRFHFNDRISLTLRAGYPSFSVGVSFML